MGGRRDLNPPYAGTLLPSEPPLCRRRPSVLGHLTGPARPHRPPNPPLLPARPRGGPPKRETQGPPVCTSFGPLRVQGRPACPGTDPRDECTKDGRPHSRPLRALRALRDFEEAQNAQAPIHWLRPHRSDGGRTNLSIRDDSRLGGCRHHKRQRHLAPAAHQPPALTASGAPFAGVSGAGLTTG